MSGEVRESPTRERTRRAILLAAIDLLSRSPRASLGAVADHAGVARSTLHRYYADRDALNHAIEEFVEEEYQAAIARARLDEGVGVDALMRLVAEFFEILDALTWWLGGAHMAMVLDRAASPDLEAEAAEVSAEDPALLALVERGREDGTIDAELSTDWIVGAMWAMIYASWAAQRAGASRADARTQGMRLIAKVLAP